MAHDPHVTRGELGLLSPKRHKVGLKAKRFFMVHHGAIIESNVGALNGPDNHTDCFDLYHTIRFFHMNKGWGDIGYNFLVCPHATDFEGVGGDYVGAHCPGFNRNGLGIAYLGNGDLPIPEAAQWRIAELYHVLSFYRGGRFKVKVHSDERATHCPGTWLRNWTRTTLGPLDDLVR